MDKWATHRSREVRERSSGGGRSPGNSAAKLWDICRPVPLSNRCFTAVVPLLDVSLFRQKVPKYRQTKFLL
ncbi:hypothetical protein K1719_003093 [Acacia pycnantha]|nr:hypothetical protein K1719_003093 [Acacia pycnantha]